MISFAGNALGLPETAFVLLRDMIHEKTGLFFDEEKRDLLGDKLASLVINSGFDNFLDYYYLLKYDAARSAAEWRRVMDALSVQETYFFREHDQLEALSGRLVPQHFRERPNVPFRIWSAACASGEEPLSIAMTLEQAGWFGRLPIEIYASDASTSALEKARNGVYRERSFRSAPAHIMHRYFQRTEDGYEADPALRGRIRWTQANVLDPAEVGDMAASHVIFCRNMFIYFSKQTVRKTIEIFAQRILAPGYLFVGAAESLLRISDQFHLEQVDGAFVYVRQND